jgi:hypothetical protein
LIYKDEFDCDSEYQYSGGKDKAALYKMQQEHCQEIINEDREENNNIHINNDIFPKHIFLYHRRSFPRKKIIKYKFKTYEEFHKETLLIAIKKELCDCLDETLKYDDNLITDFTVSFNERTTADNRFRKDRTKKVYRILNDDIKKMKCNLYPGSYVLYPLFFSTQKEYYIYSLFPYLDSGKYDSFVDVFFSTKNFYFFLNLPNNVINIPNLPVYSFYKSIQGGN